MKVSSIITLLLLPLQLYSQGKVSKKILSFRAEGFFTVYNQDDKFFLEVPDQLLGRKFIVVNRVVKAISGSGYQADDLISKSPAYFFTANGHQLNLTNTPSEILLPQEKSSVFSIASSAVNKTVVAKYDVVSRTKDGKSAVIDVTNLFLSAGVLCNAAVADFKLCLANDQWIGLLADRNLPAPTKTVNGKGGKVLVKTTIFLLPEIPAPFRVADKRIGFQTVSFKDFGNGREGVSQKDIICRWHLVPKPAAMSRYRSGQLVEPENPIEVYLDPLTPSVWVGAMTKGVQAWNRAFEHAGFKNALHVQTYPAHDSTGFFASAPITLMYALGSGPAEDLPTLVADPRSGQIIQSHVFFQHSKIAAMQMKYRLTEGLVDGGIRKDTVDREITEKLIQLEVTRLIGKALGLNYSLKDISFTPVDSLKDKNWLASHSIRSSIFDPYSFNEVAQPADGISRNGLIASLGDYDKWAIQWGYRYEENDTKSTLQEPEWKEGSDSGIAVIKGSQYGLENLKSIILKLPDWATATHQDYSLLESLYKGILSSPSGQGNEEGLYNHYILQVANLIGGTNMPVSKRCQKEAMAFLNTELFQKPVWLLKRDLLDRMNINAMQSLQALQEQVFAKLFNTGIRQLINQEAAFGLVALAPEEMVDDLYDLVWDELSDNQPVSSYRRMLQNEYVKAAIQNFKSRKEEDFAASVGNYSLDKLKKAIDKALDQVKDPATRSHYLGIQYQLNGN
ncbi:protein of unknown function [bacterium A37T11]|nr:protein of unknown function [bacterium A37T11]